MPNRLRTNAIVWLYFTNDAKAKKGKCLFCGQNISYEKSTYSNLARHLKRKHADMLKTYGKDFKSIQQPVHYVWHHFEKVSEAKAKCVYCDTYLGCPNNIVCNLLRHMKVKHPLIPLENQQEYIHHEVERLVHEPQTLDDAIEESFKASASLQETDLDMESNLNSIEMIVDDSADSVKIEFEASDPKLNDDEQEVIEEIVHDEQSHQDIQDTESVDTNATGHHTASSSYIHSNQETAQLPQESTVDAGYRSGRTQHQCEQTRSDSVSQNFLYGMQNVNVRTAAYATNVALELESVQSRQRIIAEKLISDVLFNAKLENLTEHSIVLAKLSHPSVCL